MGKIEAGKLKSFDQVTPTKCQRLNLSLYLNLIRIPHNPQSQSKEKERENKAYLHKHGSCPKVACSITSIKQQNT